MVSGKHPKIANQLLGGQRDADPPDNTGMSFSEVAVGKGRIILGKGVLEAVRDKFLVLELSTEKGPCTDEMCQVKNEIEVALRDDSPGPSYKTVDSEDFSLAISEAVYRSIDRGREEIIIRKHRLGEFVVKGFSLTA